MRQKGNLCVCEGVCVWLCHEWTRRHLQVLSKSFGEGEFFCETQKHWYGKISYHCCFSGWQGSGESTTVIRSSINIYEGDTEVDWLLGSLGCNSQLSHRVQQTKEGAVGGSLGAVELSCLPTHVAFVGWASACCSSSLGTVGPRPGILSTAKQKGVAGESCDCQQDHLQASSLLAVWIGDLPDTLCKTLRLHCTKVPATWK